MNAVVGASDAGDRIEQDKDVFACFHHAAAPLDHKAGEPDVGFQILVIRGSYHLRLDGALEVSHFLGSLINQQHQNVHFRMVGSDGIGDLLEDGGFAGARRRDDQSAGAFADGGHHVDDARFDQVGRGLELKFLDGVDRG